MNFTEHLVRAVRDANTEAAAMKAADYLLSYWGYYLVPVMKVADIQLTRTKGAPETYTFWVGEANDPKVVAYLIVQDYKVKVTDIADQQIMIMDRTGAADPEVMDWADRGDILSSAKVAVTTHVNRIIEGFGEV